MPVSLQVRFNDADNAMMQQKEISSMIKDVKNNGADAAMTYAGTLNQVSLNLGVAPRGMSTKARSAIEQRMKLAKEDPEVASLIADIKKNGPTAALKHTENQALMNKLDLIFGNVSSTMTQEAENRMKEMIERPEGGLGPIDETYGEVKPEWDRVRLLGGGKKKIGIISILVCCCCFPCGLLALVFPLDDDNSPNVQGN